MTLGAAVGGRAGYGPQKVPRTFPGGHIASLGGHLHFGLFTLPPLPQQLPLEGSHGAQQVTALHLGWRDHDAAIQELTDGAQEVLPVVRLVGSLMKQLEAGEARTKRPQSPWEGFKEEVLGHHRPRGKVGVWPHIQA